MPNTDSSEPFELRNDPPRPAPWTPPEPPKTRQRLLFAGLDCLSGQQDLFPTDGYEEDD